MAIEDDAVAKIIELFDSYDGESGYPEVSKVLEPITIPLKQGMSLVHDPGEDFYLKNSDGGKGNISSKLTDFLSAALKNLVAYPDVWDGIKIPHGLDVLNLEAEFQRVFKREQAMEYNTSTAILYGFEFRNHLEMRGEDSIDTLLVCGAQSPSSVHQVEVMAAPYKPKHVVLVDMRPELVDLARVMHPHVDCHVGDFTEVSTLEDVPLFDVSYGGHLWAWNANQLHEWDKAKMAFFFMIHSISTRMREGSGQE